MMSYSPTDRLLHDPEAARPTQPLHQRLRQLDLRILAFMLLVGIVKLFSGDLFRGPRPLSRILSRIRSSLAPQSTFNPTHAQPNRDHR